MTEAQVQSHIQHQKTGKAASQRASIFALLRDHGAPLHAAQVANLLKMRLTSARARLTEMVAKGWVLEAGTAWSAESQRKVTTYTASACISEVV